VVLSVPPKKQKKRQPAVSQRRYFHVGLSSVWFLMASSLIGVQQIGASINRKGRHHGGLFFF
jgi:hypothetical protein